MGGEGGVWRPVGGGMEACVAVAPCGRRSWPWPCMVRGAAGGGKELDKGVWRGPAPGAAAPGSLAGAQRRAHD